MDKADLQRGFVILLSGIFLLILVYVLKADTMEYYQDVITTRIEQNFYATAMQIPSSYDGQSQPVLYRISETAGPRPLLVSLHQWSEDFRAKDELLRLSVLNDYHYVRPDFRGRNDHVDACASAAAISDIDDAIAFMSNNADVDRNRIAMAGASGGGFAAAVYLARGQHLINLYSIWVPVVDLEAWYYTSLQAEQRYAGDILKCLGVEDFDAGLARSRSPLYMPVSEDRLAGTRIDILAGVYDGVTGSVPITHSVSFYNKLVKLRDPNVTQVIRPFWDQTAKHRYGMLGERRILAKHVDQGTSLILFEGSHEMFPGVVVEQIENL